MQAIILAAGMGKRLKELTQDNTKCMVKVNGKTLIERALRQLDAHNMERIIIVIGYKGELLKNYISSLSITTPILFVENTVYDKTNNIYSLYLAKDYLLQDDTILLESDLIFEDSVLEELIQDERGSLAIVDQYESWMDGTCLKLDDEDNILDVVSGKRFRFEERDSYYKTVNIYKFQKSFSTQYYIPFLEAYCKALGKNEYYEQVLRVIAMLDTTDIQAKRLNGQLWYEIDDVQDLNIAEALFAEDDDSRVIKLEERYGGYWRFPKVADFCYLVNPYYPPKKLVNEIKANFDALLTQYPSGMGVNSLLASKNFGVKQENIAIGNGAAELIKVLLEQIHGKVGIIRPTFEEYPNRLQKEQIVCYDVSEKGFTYDADALMNYFADKDIQWLFIINPDNPSGNFISEKDMNQLLSWSYNNNINILIDESFVDFAEEKYTLFDQSILEKYPNLYVMKSLSKSHGTPGLRLGILASGNAELISQIKKTVSIWNINSFAEFYMQIMEKYKSDYEVALQKHSAERKWLFEELEKIDFTNPLKSHANYIMVELLNGYQAAEVTKQALVKHNLLLKDLSAKITTGQYIRVAVKTHEENEELIFALKSM